MNTKIYNPNNKIGIRNLIKEQMESGLPTYGFLKNKIEIIRQEAGKVNKKDILSETFECLKYDNIFSILGGRGSGKTSVLLTMRNDFSKDQRNIIFPIIMPELIDKNETVISWLLSAMEKNLEWLENEIKKKGTDFITDEYEKVCKNFGLFERCVFNKNNKLRSKYEVLKNAYYSLGYNSKYTRDDFLTASEFKAMSVNSSFKVISMFVDYWNTLTEVYSCFIKDRENNSDEGEPLIFIFIDDADLKPQIINELLFVIPKYLSHPNVVIFVSASHKTLSYAVKNHMFNSITQKPIDLMRLMDIEYKYNSEIIRYGDNKTLRFHDMRYGKEYDKICRLSDQILRKIFPVYNRFYLKTYESYDDKGLILVENNEEYGSKTIPLSDKIANKLQSFADHVLEQHKLYCNLPDKPSKRNVDTISKKREHFKIIDISENLHQKPEIKNKLYLGFFGRYPRDIMSAYHSLIEMLDELMLTLDDFYFNYSMTKEPYISSELIENIYEILVKFINAVVCSNEKLSMFLKRIKDVLKVRYLHWQLYVDYSKVLEVFNEKQFLEDNRKNPDPFVEMICLLNFIEQIIVLVVPQRKKVHGHFEFSTLMERCGIAVIKNNKSLYTMLFEYYIFHSMRLIPRFDINNTEHQNNFLNAVIYMNLIDYNDEEDINEHLQWYQLLAEVIFKKYHPLARLKDYRKQLLSLTKEDFAGDDYNKLYESYYSKLQEIFFNEPKKNTSTKAIKRLNYRAKINRIASDIEDIKLCLSDLQLQYKVSNSKSLDRLLNEIVYIDSSIIKREAAELCIDVVRNKEFSRQKLISSLNYIKGLIEDEDEYLFLRRWYRDLVTHFRRNIKVQENAELKNMIAMVEKDIDNYIEYYFNEINQIIIKDTVSLDEKINKGLLSLQFLYKAYKLQPKREWQNLMRSE